MLELSSQTLMPAEPLAPNAADPANFPIAGASVAARALLVGDRIDTAALERDEALQTISKQPLAFKAGGNGLAVVFRYGVVVFVGLTQAEENDVLKRLKGRINTPFKVREREEETAQVEISTEREDQIPAGGPIYVRDLALERLLLVAYALADSVVLARDEKEVARVFDVIEPFAQKLAIGGKTPGGRRTILRLIGEALLVQHRVSGRVAVAEDPDVLWDRPDLSRLYSRLKDEYELKERVESLNRKLSVVSDTARALTDMSDTERSLRLEWLIVGLIAFEIVITIAQIAAGKV
ncbi:MAG TPA: RMD1 family protein [Xanthobacteraceae bacterium]|nr:RMD1 family protein [Xanthobacteraceae bacterium]